MRNLADPRTRLVRLRSGRWATPPARSRRSGPSRARCSSTSTAPSPRSRRSARPYLQDAITERPADARRRDHARASPTAAVPRQLDQLFAELRPGVRALRRPRAGLADALEVGTGSLRRSLALNRAARADVRRARALRRRIRRWRSGIRDLSGAGEGAQPDPRVPRRRVQTRLQLRDAVVPQRREPAQRGRQQRHLAAVHHHRHAAGPQQRGRPASSGPAAGPTEDNHLHANPYPNTASPGQADASARRRTSPTSWARRSLGNVPGNQGTRTERTKAGTPMSPLLRRRHARSRGASPLRSAGRIPCRRLGSGGRGGADVARVHEATSRSSRRLPASRRSSRRADRCARTRRSGSPASTSARSRRSRSSRAATARDRDDGDLKDEGPADPQGRDASRSGRASSSRATSSSTCHPGTPSVARRWRTNDDDPDHADREPGPARPGADRAAVRHARASCKKTARGATAPRLTHEPTAAEDADQDPDVRGETAAEALNDAFRTQPDALRERRDRQRRLLGTEPHDLSRTGRRTRPHPGRAGLARARRCRSFVTNFNTTIGALASRARRPARRDPRCWRRRSRTPNRALASLNAAFPATRAFAREILPGVRETPATIDAASSRGSTQARKLLGSRRAARARRASCGRPTAQPGSRSSTRTLDCPAAGRPRRPLPRRTSCCRPATSRSRTARCTTGAENYKEFWYTMVALAGESQNFDGNGAYVRFQPGGGTRPCRPAASSSSGDRCSATRSPAAGHAPALPGQAPALRVRSALLQAAAARLERPASNGPPDRVAQTSTRSRLAGGDEKGSDELAFDLRELLNPFGGKGGR